MTAKSSVTVAQQQGPRNYQEDRYFYKKVEGHDFHGWLMAVMDGHGGSATAELCVREIGNLFKLENADQSEEALRNLISELNSITRHLGDGSTLSAVCVLESHKKVSVAVLGDSPVVIVSQDGSLNVSPEHNVRTNAAECEAVKKRGGRIDQGYVWNSDWTHGLQMSRALGDAYMDNVISREPEVYTILSPKYIIVASDGLVDPSHANSQLFFNQVADQAERNATAQDLVDLVAARGLQDNVTALVWSNNQNR